jgi:hypothetical protein
MVGNTARHQWTTLPLAAAGNTGGHRTPRLARRRTLSFFAAGKRRADDTSQSRATLETTPRRCSAACHGGNYGPVPIRQ